MFTSLYSMNRGLFYYTLLVPYVVMMKKKISMLSL